jgi:hypothetical protein
MPQKSQITESKVQIMDFEKIIGEMIVQQKQNLLLQARRIVPHVILDDLLQPQDYPELDFHPDFRYEEGLLCGLEAALQALRTEKAAII